MAVDQVQQFAFLQLTVWFIRAELGCTEQVLPAVVHVGCGAMLSLMQVTFIDQAIGAMPSRFAQTDLLS